MSEQTTNPKTTTAIYTATQQANSFRSTLSGTALIMALIFTVWLLASVFLGAPAVPVIVARMTIFILGLWFIFNAVLALINHTILTSIRVGIETLAFTAASILTMMQQAQDKAQAEAEPGTSPAPPASTVSYLHEALLRKAQEANPPKDA